MPNELKDVLFYLAVIWGTCTVMILIGKAIELFPKLFV